MTQYRYILLKDFFSKFFSWKEVNRFKEMKSKKQEVSLEKYSSSVRKENLEKVMIIVMLVLMALVIIFLFILRNFDMNILNVSIKSNQISH